ncbi:MAG: glycosyltransferase, partial [Nitrospirae bacterium]|nr:glycosyltransferase [Nitrospirota bacterium]
MQGEETVNDLYNRALELVNAGKTVEALKAYKDILGKHTTTPSLRSMIYNDTGSILYSLGDTVNGEDFIKQAIFTDFFNAVAYRNLLKINSGKMKRQHKFSVVISTYNRKTFLKSCIESIRRNSFFPVEILVVCDPCKDGTEDYLLGESGKGDLIAIMNDKHIGVIESTNKGLLT